MRATDYHISQGKLKRNRRRFAGYANADVKVSRDTAPLMEKPLGRRGRPRLARQDTNLVSRAFAPGFFGAILTRSHLPPTDTETDHCATCRACLDICRRTNASRAEPTG